MDLTQALGEAGFDIAHPFDAHAVARELGLDVLVDPALRLGYLVGNTRALWPKFLAGRDRTAEHPLQRYTETACEPLGVRRFYSHRRYGGAFLPFQRIAVAAGLGTLAPIGLVIHPEYGPWFALRAVLLAEGEPVTRQLAAACTCGASCVDALARAQAATGPDAWRAWLAVRDSCTVGRAYRYSDDQIAYHYTKDPTLLG